MDTATAPPPVGEPELRPLDPRVQALWWSAGAISVLSVAVVTLILEVLAPLPLRTGALTTTVVLIGATLAYAIPVVRYQRWRYALREQDLWLRHGVLWVTVSVIPYRRLQFVDTRQGPLERLFGLSQLVVHTAALGTSGHLPGLDTDQAEQLRERLAELEPDVAAV